MLRTPRLLLLPVVALAACRRPAEGPPPPPPLAVTVRTMVTQDLPYTLEYLARSRGSREVEIRARTSGFLDQRCFVEGSDVAAGDLLFELDGRPLRAQEATARADILAAEARVEQTAREAKRLRPLVASEAASEREADDADSAARIAVAELTAAKARLEQVLVDLSYTRITAPIAGRIGYARRVEGALVGPTADAVLTTLVQLDPIYVTFQRTESQQVRLDRDVQQGRVVLPAAGFVVDVLHRDGSVLASGGRIDFSGSELDVATGTIPQRAVLPNPDKRLLAGQAVRVVLRGAVLKNALAVPQRAVQEGAQGKIVYVAVTKGQQLVAEPRPIEVGDWIDEPGAGPGGRAWVVESGLAAGDRVVLDHLVRLAFAPGAPITLRPEGGAAPGSTAAPALPPQPGEGR